MAEPRDAKIAPLPPLTPEEREQVFHWLDEAAQFRARLFKQRGGRVFPNAWEEFPNGFYA